jgi:large subunit ribosomal protein L21
MKAVIQIAGQQYIVQKDDEIVVDRLDVSKKTLTLEPLLITDDKNTQVGKPTVAGAKVSAKIVEAEIKGPKVKIMKFQSKKRVKTLTGHRQAQTKLVITSISV